MLWQPQHCCSRFTPAAALGNLPALPKPFYGRGGWDEISSGVAAPCLLFDVDSGFSLPSTIAQFAVCTHPESNGLAAAACGSRPVLQRHLLHMRRCMFVAARMRLLAVQMCVVVNTCCIIAAVLLRVKAGLTMSQRCNVEVGSLPI